MRTHSSRSTAFALCLTLVVVAGCSMSPTAPQPLVERTASAAAIAPGRWTEPPTEPEPVPAPALRPAAEASRTLDPLLGGVVIAGKFKLVVPPGALRQRATVTVRQYDLDVRQVELEISPKSANGFLVPVILTADCSDLPARLLSIQTIWWWNPDAQRWDAVLNAQVNLLGRSVSAPLWHFSTYKVGGKAGW